MAKRGRHCQKYFIVLTLFSALFLAGCLYGWRSETTVRWAALTEKISNLKSFTHSAFFSPLIGSINETETSEKHATTDGLTITGAETTDFSKSQVFLEGDSPPPESSHYDPPGKLIQSVKTRGVTQMLKKARDSVEPQSTTRSEILQPISSSLFSKPFPRHISSTKYVDISSRGASTSGVGNHKIVSSSDRINTTPIFHHTNSFGNSGSLNSTDSAGSAHKPRQLNGKCDINGDTISVTEDDLASVKTELLPSSLLHALTSHSPSPLGGSNSSASDKNTTYLITINHEQGRLGNKLFKYASLLGIANATGRRAFVLPYSPTQDLGKIFQLSRVENRTDQLDWTVVTETKYGYFDPIFNQLPYGHVRISGYVQSWKYFDRIQAKVRQELTFRPAFRDLAKRTKDEIRHRLNDTELVFAGVHVRQRDSYSNPNTCEAPRSFFVNAFGKLRALLPGKKLVFVVAGNNLRWCRENLRAPDVVVLDHASPEVHFAVLASCDHSVVSVGSYGWWAAWLSGGLVVFYKRFPLADSYEAKGFVYEDYYPPHWYPVDE